MRPEWTSAIVAGIAAASTVWAGQAIPEARRVGRVIGRARRELADHTISTSRFGLPAGRVLGVRDRVAAIGLPLPAHEVVAIASAAVVTAGLIGLAFGGLVPAFVFAALAIGAFPVGVRWMRVRRSTMADRALPELFDAMARSVRSGSSLHQAVVFGLDEIAPGPLGPETEPLRRALRGGRPLVVALDAWASSATTTRRLAMASLSLTAETGGMPARILDSVAETLRDREALRLEARALSTQARASAAVVAAAPLAFTTLAVVADRRVGAFLFATVVGWACLLGGLTLEAVGAAWMTWLVRRP